MTTTTDVPADGFRRRLALHGEDWLALFLLAALFVFALVGAFAHMHDWTIEAINEALREAHEARGAHGEAATVPDWFGWTNAITSEIMPTYALLTIRKRQRQGRPIGGPATLFVGSSALSILAQLSATGVRLPYDAQLLVCLPAVALMILGVFKFSDMSYARDAAERAELAAEKERRRLAREAELAAIEAAEKAELAAELERQREADAAELARQHERERLDAEAERAERLARIEAEAVTRRAEIEAAERREAREADERRRAAEAEAERRRLDAAARIEAEARAEALRVAAEARAARARAEADRIAAEAEARRLAAERVAAARGGRSDASDDEAAGRRVRRPRHETQALVDDVLALLAPGTERPAAVAAVSEQLNVTPEYARQFVPNGWVAGSSAAEPGASSDDAHHEADGSSAPRRHLVAVGSA